MSSQLRIYTIRPDRLGEFEKFWRGEILPLRRQFGFTVEGAWSDPNTNTFVWVAGHPDFATADADYYASPDRRNLSKDPGEFIERMDLRLLEPVDFD